MGDIMLHERVAKNGEGQAETLMRVIDRAEHLKRTTEALGRGSYSCKLNTAGIIDVDSSIDRKIEDHFAKKNNSKSVKMIRVDDVIALIEKQYNMPESTTIGRYQREIGGRIIKAIMGGHDSPIRV
jgi:hypothetical protein